MHIYGKPQRAPKEDCHRCRGTGSLGSYYTGEGEYKGDHLCTCVTRVRFKGGPFIKHAKFTPSQNSVEKHLLKQKYKKYLKEVKHNSVSTEEHNHIMRLLTTIKKGIFG